MSKKEKEVKLSEFQVHSLGCKKCQSVDLKTSSTFINVCLVGAPLLRDHLNVIASKEARARNRALKIAFEDTTRTTKQKLKSVMRYVSSELIA